MLELEFKNSNSKSINDTVLTGINLIKNLLGHIMALRETLPSAGGHRKSIPPYKIC